MKKRNKLFITGASGFLGWNLAKIARAKWDVYGIYHRHYSKIHDVSLIKLDITDFQNLKKVFNDVKPDAVIHTAAASRPNFCQEHPLQSRKINVLASANIADLCAAASIPLVFTSTDLVFDGLNPPYSETSPVSPITEYSEQKVTAEEKMVQIYPKTAICRLPLMFGYSGSPSQNFTKEMIDSLKKGKKLHLFSDEYRTPVDAQSAVKGLLLFLSRIEGVIHLGGSDRISRYEMGLLVAELFNYRTTWIQSVKQKDLPMAAPRPVDVSLDSSKAMSMGYTPDDIRTALEKTKKIMGSH